MRNALLPSLVPSSICLEHELERSSLFGVVLLSEVPMSKLRSAADVAAAQADARDAWAEHLQAQEAEERKTLRLRALRVAREEADRCAPPAPKPETARRKRAAR